MRCFPALRLLPAIPLLSLAACTDRNPASAPETPSAVPPSAVSAMACTVSITAGTLSCGAPGAGPDASAAVLGGQGTNVRLTSTGMSYDGTSTFRMNVTVENLAAQALGTADGVTPSPDGVRVFFFDGPTATGGTGPVVVANEDGEGIFTAAGQKYFQYDGILAPGLATGAKEWRFTLPSTVTSFGFKVYVHAPVRAEGGWIGMTPIAAAVAVGDTQRVEATLRTLTGGVAGGEVAWTTSNASVATVDVQGLVTGVAVGTATVTAASGGRTGSVEVLVHAPAFNPPPTFRDFRVAPPSVTAGQGLGDSILHLQFRNSDIYSPVLRVLLRSPVGVARECSSYGPFEYIGGGYSEVRCGVGFADGTTGGAWTVERVELGGRTLSNAALLAAGASAHVYVHSPNEDRTAPTVDSLAILTDTVIAGVSEFEMRVWVRDDLVGAGELRARIGSTGNPGYVLLGQAIQWTGDQVLYRVHFVVPQYYHGGTFRVDSVWVYDANRNRRRLTKAELATAGFETEFTVTGGTPDTTAPAITGFSFSPLTVSGNETDTVTVTLSAQEPLIESGVWFLDMEFQKRSDESQRRRCLLNGSTRVYTRTMTCKLVFGPGDAGSWWVRYIRAIDFSNNSRELAYAEVRAAGYPVDLAIQGAVPDTAAPRIAAFSFSPQTVAGNGADSISMTFTATEPASEAGVWFMDVVFEKVSNTTQFRRCLVNRATPALTETLACRQAFAAGDAGEWRVRYIRAIDFMNNTHLLRTADLQAAGYSTQLTITPP